MYYQRLLANQGKSSVAAEIQTSTPKPEYEKAIKDPYIMEFLQIKPDTHVYEGDNPPIGIVLCAEKNDAVVKYTVPEGNNQIFASKYFTYLPTEEELKRELRIDEFRKIEE